MPPLDVPGPNAPAADGDSLGGVLVPVPNAVLADAVESPLASPMDALFPDGAGGTCMPLIIIVPLNLADFLLLFSTVLQDTHRSASSVLGVPHLGQKTVTGLLRPPT